MFPDVGPVDVPHYARSPLHEGQLLWIYRGSFHPPRVLDLHLALWLNLDDTDIA